MFFTDLDIETAKINGFLSKEKIQALLERLEAAENMAYLMEKYLGSEYPYLIEVWRKSRGK